MRAALHDSALIEDIDVPELEVIDLTDPLRTSAAIRSSYDLRTFEERYATLAFGLGVVPRRQHPDDPLWARPAGLLLGLCGILAFLLLLSAAQ
jgi:hypothetical protein